ncbi:hypothetical protein DFH05DRAFT_1513801 [Lentinula detonsa]|uniref:Uncharacterized protein n=1 Tax=Lentinula detonsa TaxID=2804962 RepID=A0A9W8NRN5_9AGAR|nr:hypothetical protein DFH05DRAFT_1513801 [Lentinula detonsa]
MGFTHQTPLTQILLILLICGGMFGVVAMPLAELPPVDTEQLERRVDAGYRNPMWYLDRRAERMTNPRLPLKTSISKYRPEEWTLYLTSTGFRAEKKEGTLIALPESEIRTLMYRTKGCQLEPSLHFTELEQLIEVQNILRDIPRLQKELGPDVHFEDNLDYILGIAQYLTKVPLGQSKEHVLLEVPLQLKELTTEMKKYGLDGSFPSDYSTSFDPSRPPLSFTHSGASQSPAPPPPPPPATSLNNLDGTRKRKDTDILDGTKSKKIKADMDINRIISQ